MLDMIYKLRQKSRKRGKAYTYGHFLFRSSSLKDDVIV